MVRDYLTSATRHRMHDPESARRRDGQHTELGVPIWATGGSRSRLNRSQISAREMPEGLMAHR